MSIKSVDVREGKIHTLDVNYLNINQDSTSVKWNPAKKNSDIFMLNGIKTAKLSANKSGEKGILGNISYIIGTDVDAIVYVVHQGSVINIGLATSTRSLSSLASGTDLISQQFSVTRDTTITMTLSRTLVSTLPNVYNSTLLFKQDEKTIAVDVTAFNGQVMYPWLSDDSNGTGFSVSLSKVSALKTYIRDDGSIIFSSVNESGVSRPIIFKTGDDQVIFDNVGFSSVPSITYDIVETSTAVANGIDAFDMTLRVAHTSAPGTSNPGVTIGQNALFTSPEGISSPYIESPTADLILRRSGGSNVTVTVAGAMVLPGTLTTTRIISNTLQPPVGNNVSVLEGSGKGLIIQDITGDSYFSDRLAVGDGGNLTSANVLASFNTTTHDQALVIPTVTDVTISTIPILQQVTGMIVYSIADDKFMGFKPSGWVDLSV
jgi:hypothetical protein